MQNRSSRRLPAPGSHGFTLIELMIVVAIAAILAAIAVPAYNRYVVRSKLHVAFGQMQMLATQMAQYAQDQRTYVGACQANTVAPLPTSSDFQYACPTLTATQYLITATGLAGTPLAGFAFSFDQNGTKATLATPSGWAGSGSLCWVQDAAGTCAP